MLMECNCKMDQNEIPPFEPELGKQIFSTTPKDRTYIEKLMASAELKRMQELHKQTRLTEEQLNEYLHLMTGLQAKMLNFDEWDRIALALFFTKVRSVVGDVLLRYKAKHAMQNIEKDRNFKYTERAWMLFDNDFAKREHSMKYLMDIFQYVSNSSLSRSGYAFDILASNKYDIVYSASKPPQQTPRGAPSGGAW